MRSARHRNLVIPVATIERVASRLETHGSIEQGYLGLGLQPIWVEGQKDSAAIIISNDANGPAAAAGLFQGDILTSWNALRQHCLRRLYRQRGRRR